MWQLSVPWWEFVLRALVVYGFLLVLLRLTGKRQVGQLSAFDLVLLLILSNAVQNSMNAGDNTVTAGMILAVTLVAVNYLVGWFSFRSRAIDKLVQGHPEILIRHGRLRDDIMGREQITRSELDAAIRAAGCPTVHDVDLAVLETNGHITVVQKKDHSDARPGHEKGKLES